MPGEGEGERGGEGVPLALVLYSMHATVCYSIAQHMFSYAVPESAVSILLASFANFPGFRGRGKLHLPPGDATGIN